jgi:diguanylate cyclase (GGDEF)-like protein
MDEPPVQHQPAPPPGGGASLLIIDDDATTRTLVARVFGEQGFEVVAAADGAQGLETFGRCRPDVVLLDVMMPVMDGFAACRAMRDQDGHDGTPIIMLTGAEDLDAIARAFEAGATDFVTKPITWPLLLQRVRFAVRSGVLMREARRQRLREIAAQRAAQLAFFSLDPDSGQFDWPDELTPVAGCEGTAIATMSALLERTHPEDRERLQRAVACAGEDCGRIELELRLHCDGQERVMRLVGERGGEGRDRTRIFGALQNITETRRAESLVEYLAEHDELTGLGNRKLFSPRLSQRLLRFEREGEAVLLVLWLDITRFHRFNDGLGESSGDALLQKVALRLRSRVGEEDVARVSGDEFAVVLAADNAAEAQAKGIALLDALEKPYRLRGQETYLGFTAGTALFHGQQVDAAELLSMAQEAQRTARRQNQRCVSAGQSRSVAVLDSLDVERALRQALARDELHVVYQPQMSLREGRIVGAEALLRWDHPTRGAIGPAEFVPILEQTNQIAEVGAWVIGEACRQARRWELAGTPLRVGINLSASQLLDTGLFDVVAAATQDTGVSHRNIELEVTESLAMQDPERAIALLGRLSAADFRIAIDDFGIGHSSLEYLLRFPLDTIKIDRSFVSHITRKRTDRAIVRAITAIAQTLDVDTIAEGIETQRQCDFIEALGVTEVQGFLVGKPMSAAALSELLGSFRRPGHTD